MDTQPDIHITRLAPQHSEQTYELLLRDAEHPQRLARILAARLQKHASSIQILQAQNSLRLVFTADKVPLGKWELGRINREALLRYMIELPE